MWQVVVAASHRRRGLARAMIRAILDRPSSADIRAIETTVSPSNEASTQMFRALAAELGAPIEPVGGFGASLFPSANGSAPHEEEIRYRIGPFARATAGLESSHA